MVNSIPGKGEGMRFPKKRQRGENRQPEIEQSVPTETPDPIEQEEEPMSAALNVETATEDELVGAIDDVMDRLSIEHLVRVRSLADQRISSKKEETRAQLLARFRAEAAEMGMSLFEVLPQPPRTMRRSTGTAPVKYRHPETGQTWSGRGVPATWVREAKERGEDIEQYNVSRKQGELEEAT